MVSRSLGEEVTGFQFTGWILHAGISFFFLGYCFVAKQGRQESRNSQGRKIGLAFYHDVR